MRRAVIDIGTNTVKLLVADVKNGDVCPVFHSDVPSRLGEGFHRTGMLAAPAIARTVEAIKRFQAEAVQQGAQEVIGLTTSAAREAGNGGAFLAAVRRECGLEVEIVTGEREAALIYRGVASEPRWSERPLLVMDVGGGSAEFIMGVGGKVERLKSLPVGAVRLTERFGEDFGGLCGFLRETLRTELGSFSLAGRALVATGGTILTLARVAQTRSFVEEQLRELVLHLNALSLPERKEIPGLPPERADIIVAGGMVYVAAMETLGARELAVSERCLRHGARLVSP